MPHALRLSLLLSLVTVSAAVAQSELLTLGEAPSLAPSEVGSVEVRVDVATEVPLMLTASEQGTAVEVVRGRLLRSDAIDPEARPLVFQLPLRGRSTGTGVLLVRVDTYACEEGGDCREIHDEGRLTIEVRRRR